MSDKKKEKLIERTLLRKGKILHHYVDKIKTAAGNIHEYDYIYHPGAVVLIPIDKEENILLIKQWRRTVNQEIIEFPAGTIEEGEDPLKCAERELREETGFRANTFIPFGECLTVPGFCTERLVFYIALDLHPDPLPQDETEDISLYPCSMKHALEQVENGKIIDAKTILGILKLENYIKRSM